MPWVVIFTTYVFPSRIKPQHSQPYCLIYIATNTHASEVERGLAQRAGKDTPCRNKEHRHRRPGYLVEKKSSKLRVLHDQGCETNDTT